MMPAPQDERLLQSRYVQLRQAQVTTAAEMLRELGPPSTETRFAGRRTLQWQSGGYSMAANFDGNDVLLSAGQEFASSGDLRDNSEWLRVVVAVALMVMALVMLVDPL